MPLERTASIKRAMRNTKEKIPVALISPNEMGVASHTQCNIDGSSNMPAGERYGPR
jgi:hypothetical protein